MKKLITIMILSSAALLSRADESYLYWMVDITDSEYVDSFAFATLKESSTGQYLLDKQTGVNAIAANDDGLTTSAYDFVMPTAFMSSTYSFILELYNESGSMVGWSTAVNFDEFSGHIFSGMQPTGANPYVFSAVVPEPTSGMLFLVGLALLGLRRKSKCKI